MDKLLYEFDIDMNYLVFKKPVKELTRDTIEKNIKEKVEGIIFEKCEVPIDVIDSFSLSFFPNLKEVIFYRKVNFVNSNAFLFNPLLKEVQFVSVGLISRQAFYGCLELQKIELNYNTFIYTDSFDSITRIKRKSDIDNKVLDNKFINKNIAYKPDDFLIKYAKRKQGKYDKLFRILQVRFKARCKRFIIIPSKVEDIQQPKRDHMKSYLIPSFIVKPTYILGSDSFHYLSGGKRTIFIDKDVYFLDKKKLFKPKCFKEIQFSHSQMEVTYPFPNIHINITPLLDSSSGYSYNIFQSKNTTSLESKSIYREVSNIYYLEALKYSSTKKDYYLMGAYLGNKDCVQTLVNENYFTAEKARKKFGLEINIKVKKAYDKKQEQKEKEEIEALKEQARLAEKQRINEALWRDKQRNEKEEQDKKEKGISDNQLIEKIQKADYYFINPDAIQKFVFTNPPLVDELKKEIKKESLEKIVFEYCKNNKFTKINLKEMSDREITYLYISLCTYESFMHTGTSFASTFYQYMKKNKDFALYMNEVRNDLKLAKNVYDKFYYLKKYFDEAKIKYGKALDLLLYELKCSHSFYYKAYSTYKIKNIENAWVELENSYIITNSMSAEEALTVLFTYIKYINEIDSLPNEKEYIKQLVYYGMQVLRKLSPTSNEWDLFRYIEDSFITSKHSDIAYIFVQYFHPEHLKNIPNKVFITAERANQLMSIFNSAILINKKRIFGSINDEDIMTFGSEQEIAALKQKRKQEQEQKERKEAEEERIRQEAERKRKEEAERARLKQEEEVRKRNNNVQNVKPVNSSSSSTSDKSELINGRTLESYFDDVICPYPKEISGKDDSGNIEILASDESVAGKNFFKQVYWDYWKAADYRNAFTCQLYLKNNSRLGIHYYYGLGVKKDIRKAFLYLQRAYFSIQANSYSIDSFEKKELDEYRSILLKIDSIAGIAYRPKISGNKIRLSDFESDLKNKLEMMFAKSFSNRYFEFPVFIKIERGDRNIIEDIYGNKFIKCMKLHIYPSDACKDNWEKYFDDWSSYHELKSTMNDVAWDASYLDDEYKTSKDYRDAVDTINIRKNQAREADEYRSHERMKKTFHELGDPFVAKILNELPKDTCFVLKSWECKRYFSISKELKKELENYEELRISKVEIKFHYTFKYW